MKRYRIVYDNDALSDLADIEIWIAAQAGPRVAAGYTAQIRKFCSRLRHMPHRGVLNDDIRPGVRILGFKKRVNIAFEVSGDQVVVIRILYAGRQFDGD